MEKDINLKISLKLNNILKALGFNTVMVRTTDTAVNTDGDTIRQKKVSDIKFRYSFMQEYPDSIYLCIHQNKYSSAGVNGTQIFYSPNDSNSKLLAEYLQESIINGTKQNRTRPLKPCTDDVYLIHNATTSAVLIECGFLSNQNDLNKLKTDEYQQILSFSIASGLINMINDS